MIKILVICLIMIGFSIGSSITVNDHANKIGHYLSTYSQIAQNSTLALEYENSYNKLLELEPWYFNFTPFKSDDYYFDCVGQQHQEGAKDVHSLSPSSFRIIAALGDGFSTGLASIHPLDKEYRDLSWSIGGIKTDFLYYLLQQITLPNILRLLNGNPKGYNVNYTPVIYSSQNKIIDYNSAIAGTTSETLPDQATRLIELLKNDRSIDFNNDWKLLTIFIGANDLCQCYSKDTFTKMITDTLNTLYKEVPRIFINLVNLFNLDEVNTFIIYLSTKFNKKFD